jgi:hypothetical protein
MHCLSVGLACAQEAANSVPGVSFELRLKDGKTQYRQGERITIELIFSSTLPGRYRVNTRSYDRSGRLNMDSLQLAPKDGVSDPMEDYFRSQLAFIGGGLHGVPELKEEPVVVVQELNEWFRFDRPGAYRLRVVTPRVTVIPPPDEDQWPGQSVELTSNEVYFQIIEAEPAWSAQALAEAVQALDRPSTGETLSDDARHACRTIRFLGTPAAVREMVRRLGLQDYCGFDWMAGLMGSPHRELVLKELEAGLASPWQPVTEGYLWTLSSLAFLKERPEGLRPAAENPQEQAYQEQIRKLVKQRQAMHSEYPLKLWKLLPSKRDPARVTTLQTLLQASLQQPETKELAAVRPQIVNQLGPMLPTLSQSRLSGLLNYQWRYLSSATAVLPALRQIYEQSPVSHWKLNDLALRRIYDLSPSEGRRLILEEIRRLEPRVGIDVLRLLPDELLEELDAVFLNNLEENKKRELGDAFALHCRLVERYASERILSRVREVTGNDPTQWWGDTAAGLLAYFLRTDPENGLGMIATAATKPCERCSRNLLISLARLRYTPPLEKLALQLLDHPDATVVEDAANMLRERGSVETRDQLWRRLAGWNKIWEGREKDLRYTPNRNSFHEAEARLEGALTQALARAGAWVLNGEEFDRLASYCVTKQCGQSAGQWRREQDEEMHVRPFAERWHLGSFQLGSWAALLEKVAQFPSGSRFGWFTNQTLTEEDDRRLCAELENVVAATGMRLRRY